MALTPSTMLELGTKAPDFTLPDSDGQEHTLYDEAAEARAVVVVFMCNHCPYVKQYKQHFGTLFRAYQEKGVRVFAINSNDADNYPDDAPEKMKQDVGKFGYTFPYLYDETQEVAKAYKAACTPDFFVFDADLKLAYRGQYDDARPGNDAEVTGVDMKAALESVLDGVPVPDEQKPSMGCNIKWKPGNQPDYS